MTSKSTIYTCRQVHTPLYIETVHCELCSVARPLYWVKNRISHFILDSSLRFQSHFLFSLFRTITNGRRNIFKIIKVCRAYSKTGTIILTSLLRLLHFAFKSLFVFVYLCLCFVCQLEFFYYYFPPTSFYSPLTSFSCLFFCFLFLLLLFLLCFSFIHLCIRIFFPCVVVLMFCHPDQVELPILIYPYMML